ncbi:putative centromere protein J-like, partial [Triplophysa rosa]
RELYNLNRFILRPIRPGLREKQKTFEEFVEEHLKVHQAVLQPKNQASTQITLKQKKNFLRKGEGTSRIGKDKDDSQMIHRRHSVNAQQQKICLDELHQTGKKKDMPNASRIKQRHSLPNTKDQKYDLKEFQRKPVDPQDDNIQKQANSILSADKEKVKPLTSSIVDNANSLKKKHSSEVLSIYGKTTGSMSQKSALIKYNTAPAQSRYAPKVDPSEENVGFKKINDHIVKVNEINGLPTNRLHNRSERSKETSKEFMLTNEVMESLALSDSNNSTSSEDGPVSQSHRPVPHFPSRHADHKDQSLDLSDDDYASDAPSEIEIVNRFSEDRRSSTPTSSSSSSICDSELQNLQESMTNHFKKTEDQHVGHESKWTRDTPFRPPSASERLMKETETHGFSAEDDHRHKEDPAEIHEPEDVRHQIFSLKQKLMEKEVHWSHVHSLLQSRVEALTRENQELCSKLKGIERSQPGSYNTCDKSREDAQKTPRERSATPAFNKPSIHKKEALIGHPANGQSVTKAVKRPEPTASSLRKNSACSVDVGNPDINAMITRDRKEGFLYRNVDCSDAQMVSQGRSDKVKEEIRYPDGRVERLFWNGCRVITFRNGTKKEIGVDKSVTVTFFNGDVKRILADGTLMYYYCDAQTTHSTYPSGLEVLQFPNNQREKRHPDGKREITFPDGTLKILYPDGQEESIFPDGTVVRISKHGEKIVEFTNGQREIHTSQYKRRIYPDGTVKTVYTNGQQETKFSSGRVRTKNNEGFIIMD